jgi:hypothetical protein
MAISTLDKRPSMFIRDKPVFLSERVLHKDYDHKDSARGKKFVVVSLEGLGTRTH